METEDTWDGELDEETSQVDTKHDGYARSSVREQTGRAKERAKEKAGELKESAERKAEELKEAATRRTDELTSRVGTRMGRVARALHQAGEGLRQHGEPNLAAATADAASYVARVGSYMDSSPEQMIADLERTARIHPAYFVGGAFAAGILIGRLLKADPARDEHTYYDERDEEA